MALSFVEFTGTDVASAEIDVCSGGWEAKIGRILKFLMTPRLDWNGNLQTMCAHRISATLLFLRNSDGLVFHRDTCSSTWASSYLACQRPDEGSILELWLDLDILMFG